MTILAPSLFVVVTISESLLGIGCNGFICLMNCISLIKSKKMSLLEFLITSLTICRICFLWIIIADVLILLYSDFHESSLAMQIFSLLWIFVNFLSIWLVTCLSILYCLKIANFSHRVFLWLKWRVSSVVRRILLASVLFSFSTLIMAKELGATFCSAQMTFAANCSEDIREKQKNYFYNYVFIVLWMVIPFIVSLISYLLIILSLRRHIQQMQNNGTGSRDPSIEAHVRATKITLSFLFLFIMYLVAFLIIIWGFFMPDTKLAWMIGEMILAAHPSVHSIFLIFVNNKLKQAFLGIFQIKK